MIIDTAYPIKVKSAKRKGKVMPCIAYKSKNFRESSLETIEKANSIITEYADDGYDLTLRQLYYQFVARGFIPNSDREYKRLGGTINEARLAGLLDWDAIVDRTRMLRSNNHWVTPQEVIDACAEQFRLDTRQTQDNYVEVWVEKDALIGVLEQVCTRLDVSYFSCRGYVSQSAMWGAAQRIRSEVNPVILHLGDHDPSGMDMTRDIRDRLQLFGCEIEVKRIALNMDQVDQYNPPPNPAKITDSRSDSYITHYGNESWELDALDPRTITTLIEDCVGEFTDSTARNLLIEDEESHKRDLTQVSQQWDDILDNL